jgi:nucleoside-diphosphate-sugar epimerase
MKILIIGGTGLISTAITRQLLERGDEVTLYTRGQSPTRFEGQVTRITGDRTDHAAFEAQIRAAGRFDCVIDMVGYEAEDAASLVRAVCGRTDHVIFCSTVDVYAKPASTYPIRVDEPRRPITAYAEKKVLCEDILLGAHRRGDVPVSILRATYTYGEGARGVIHSLGFRTTFLDRLRRGQPIIVHGNGTSLWNPCHIDDVARGFLGAAGNARAFGHAYNVTGEEAVTWNQLTAKVAEAMGAPPPEIVHIPTDILARIAPHRAQLSVENIQYPNVHDTSSARADLGFRYTISIVEGMRRTIAWLDAHGLIEDSSADPCYDAMIAAWHGAIATIADAFAGRDG